MQLRDSPAVRAWFTDEENPLLQQEAMREFERYRHLFTDNSWFCVPGGSLHYYFNNQAGEYSGHERAYTLDRASARDRWYFDALNKSSDFQVNAGFDKALNLFKFWINVPVRDASGHALGMLGTGMDLKAFMNHDVRHTELGGDVVLIDDTLRVQGYRDEALMDIRSRNSAGLERTAITQLLPREEDRELLKQLTREGIAGAAVRVLSMKMHGQEHLVGIGGIPNTNLFVMVSLRLSDIIGHDTFWPLLTLLAVSMIMVLSSMTWLLERLVLRRVRQLQSAVLDMEQGKVVAFAGRQTDELGRLMAAFASMAGKVRGYTDELETTVNERTRSLQERLEELDALRAKLAEQAIRDNLTGLYNRNYYEEVIGKVSAHIRRHKSSAAMVLLDIDHFKRVNDHYGHHAGDVVLREIASRIATGTRHEDDLFRWGGEEFLLIMHGADEETGRAKSEMIRAAIAAQPVCLDGTELAITGSFGVAVLRDGTDPDSAIRAADAALYRAKRLGRNRVVLAEC